VHGTSPRDEHGDHSLIVPIDITEIGHEISFLEDRGHDHPGCPQNIKEQAVRSHVGRRPYEDEHAEIQGVPDPPIWTPYRKWKRLVRSTMHVRPDRPQTERVEPTECMDAPGESQERRSGAGACYPESETFQSEQLDV